ncbi:MAG: AfsR/SARP family transcriptional regulator, partial [Spirochaetota bacterium]
MTSDVVTLRLFGTPTLYRDAQVTHISRRKAQGLLAYLALADRPVPRSELCGRFWPDLRIEAARRALRTVLSEVRTLLPDGVLDASRDAVALRCGDLLQTDALVFEREAGRLLDAVRRRGGELSTEDLGQIDALNELAGAPFLDGFSLPDCADFDDWQFMTGERLRGRRMELLWAQITACVERDDRIRAIAAARALLALDPSDDETHRELMVLLTEVGASGAAIAQARVFERIAEHENDEPDYASVRELTDAIRQQRTACLPDESKSAESRERERAMQDTDERRIVSLVGVWSDDVALESVAAAAADLCDGTVADRASTGSNAAVLTFGLARTHDDDPARAVMAARSLAAYLAAQGGTIRAVVRKAIVSPSDIETALVAMRATVARLGAGEVAVCDATRRAIDGLQTEP